MAKVKVDETLEVRDQVQRLFPNAKLNIQMAPGRRRGDWWVARIKYTTYSTTKTLAGGGSGEILVNLRQLCAQCAIPELEVTHVHLFMKCGRVFKDELAAMLQKEIWGDPSKHYLAMLNATPCPIVGCRWCGGTI